MPNWVMRRALLAAVSAGALTATTAFARDTAPPADPATATDPVAEDAEQLPDSYVDSDGQTITVTGVRASLERAERVKRDAPIMVDGISADEIGQLPDASMTEAILTVPGIDVNGNGALSARGLGRDFVNQEINGRIIPSPQPGTRAVQTGSFPSQGLSGLFLQKTPDSSTIEGGSGGTVLIQTIHPLDTKQRGLQVLVRGYTNTNSAKLSRAEQYANVAPRISATWVGKLADNFGVAFTYERVSEYKTNIWNQGSGWSFDTAATAATRLRNDLNGDGRRDSLPIALGEQVGSDSDFRNAALGMIQWDVTPSLRISLDGIYNVDHLRNEDRTFTATGINVGTNGAATSATVNQYDVVVAMNAPVTTYRGNLDFQNQKDTTFGGGLNLAFNNGGRLSFKADASYFKAFRRGSVRNFVYDLDSTATTVAAIPKVPFSYNISDPFHSVYNFQPFTADDFALSSGSIGTPRINDTVAAIRADFAYRASDDDFLRSIQFGVRVDRRHKTARQNTLNYTFGQALLPNGTRAAVNPNLRPDLDGTFLELQTNPLAGKNPYVTGTNTGMFPWFNIDKIAALITSANTNIVQAPSQITGYIDNTEDTFALYASANFETGILSGNIGARYVLTDATIKGLQGNVTASTLVTYPSSYGYLLPQLNAKLQLTPAFDVRLGLNKTVTRPIFTDTTVGSNFNPVTALAAGRATINSGNPNLKPYTSNGIDVALEWFPSRSTSLTLNGFVRFIKGFTDDVQTAGTVTIGDVTIPAIITQPFNNPEIVRFGGFELTGRQQFDFLPGFLKNIGVQANWQHSYTDATANRVGLTQSADATLPAIPPVVGLPGGFSKDIVNGQIFYGDERLQLRANYRYSTPLFNLGIPDGTLNLTASYKLTKNVRVMSSVTNIAFYKGDRRWAEDPRVPANDYTLNKSMLTAIRNTGKVIQFGVNVSL
jgi:iron complex outermembrane recepter protein